MAQKQPAHPYTLIRLLRAFGLHPHAAVLEPKSIRARIRTEAAGSGVPPLYGHIWPQAPGLPPGYAGRAAV